MFYEWVVLPERVDGYLNSGQQVEEEHVQIIPDNASTALIQSDVREKLPDFEKHFTNDAWIAVMSLSKFI